MKIEVGDFALFPLAYTSGTAPISQHDIALSAMNADALDKQVGNTLYVEVSREDQLLSVCGIYQDVTNGGKTAKAMLPYQAEDIIWLTINITVKEGLVLSHKIGEYATAFPAAKVTDVNAYIAQTMGSIREQLQLIVILAFLLGICIAALVTTLFF